MDGVNGKMIGAVIWNDSTSAKMNGNISLSQSNAFSHRQVGNKMCMKHSFTTKFTVSFVVEWEITRY